METPIINPLHLALLIRFGYTMSIIFLVSFFLYYKRNGNSEYLFTYLVVGAIVFNICILLKTITLDIGFALGLFAVFAILRYRTSQLSIREITYLFVIVGFAVLDGLTEFMNYLFIVVADGLIVLIIYIGELIHSHNKKRIKTVLYERIELLQQDKYDELIEDLQKRLSLTNILKVKIGNVNLLRDTARLKVYFLDENDNNFNDDVRP